MRGPPSLLASSSPLHIAQRGIDLTTEGGDPNSAESHGDGEFDITEIDITESAITNFQESDITESDITEKGN